MKKPTISIIGGTGNEGKGLAYRGQSLVYEVIIGSRQEEKAFAAVEEIKLLSNSMLKYTVMQNMQAAIEGDLVCDNVPYSAHRATLETIKDAVQGKILIDVTVSVDAALCF